MYLLVASLVVSVYYIVSKPVSSTGLLAASKLEKPWKILFVDSYHEGYPWSEGIVQGVRNSLKIHSNLDENIALAELRLVRMDTKRHPEEAFKEEAGRKVKSLIDEWRPDLVIAADDNAAKYVVVPFLKDTDLPVVFCGINWTAEAYGFPCRNVTGMLEVALIPNLLTTLKPYVRGQRVGLLGANNESNQKEVEAYRGIFKLELAETVLVDDLAEWKTAYSELQDKVDLLILAPPSFLMAGPGTVADQTEARRFVEHATKIPTASVEDWIAPYSMACFAKRSQEHGEWAAKTALEILGGRMPSTIKVAQNQQAAIILNMPLAKKLGLHFPVELMEMATMTEDATVE